MSISLKYVVKPTLGFHGAPQGVGSLNQSGSGDWLRYVQQSEANVYNGLNNLHEMRGTAGVRSKKKTAHIVC